MSQEEIYKAVETAVADALGMPADEIGPDATLMDELGAESIDLLDILFRLQKSVGVKIQASDLGEYVQGGIPDEEFGDEREVVTPKGMEQLKKVMPQIDESELLGRLTADKVMSLFTVQNLADMVEGRVAPAGG